MDPECFVKFSVVETEWKTKHSYRKEFCEIDQKDKQVTRIITSF